MRRKNVSMLFRFTDLQVVALEQLRELIRWKRAANHDWNSGHAVSKTEALMIALEAVVGELTSQKRTWTEKQEAKPKAQPKKQSRRSRKKPI
jgi:hypothetical protein